MKDSGRSLVVAENPEGRGPFVILCDHASNRIPEAFQSFGFAEDALQTHIAWDPGALCGGADPVGEAGRAAFLA